MENFSKLKEFVLLKKRNLLILNSDIVEECGAFEPALTDYVIVLNREKLDDLREYIKDSDIRDKEHTLKSLERIPAAVVRVMINRINIESMTLAFINEHGGVQGVLDYYDREEESDSAEKDSMGDEGTSQEFEDMFQDVECLREGLANTKEAENVKDSVPEDSSVAYIVEKPYIEEFPKTYEKEEDSYKELSEELSDIQENLKYLIGTVNLLAAKNGVHVRDTKYLLTTKEILKFVASLRSYTDQQFRAIIEGVCLKAQTEEQRRVVSDMLSEVITFIEKEQEDNCNE